jgi:4-hydroxy-tetrahydrodipicolinate reductase
MSDKDQISYSVIGTGKTGSAVVELLGDAAVPFNSENPATVSSLQKSDIAIIFVPGSAAEQVVETVLEAGIPAIWGTTGYQWPADLSNRVKNANARWVIGSNFSLGMNLVRKALTMLGKGSDLLAEPAFHIHEVHHKHKQDAPSGTALSWQEWLGKEANISSDRQGDVKGIHNLHIKTAMESIRLEHEAHSRALFAEGAVWAANYILAHPYVSPGVYSFSDLFDKAYKNL